ncbi:TorF family putative porin [Methyloradius palustris]|uniref:Uncharacterized protein n=1 Tax=Methyloradius palustris TaxID=2778876 RepID=A0A8D5JMR9_9PROT|nr:TorF family putative porin [Methyloradius palustris]BCM26140.1 hypothetical protein ZMTM_23990 [Methyloradius palustris]
MTQTAGGPALQGGVDLTHSSGLYIGAWGSNQSWLQDAGAYTHSSLEADVYGGYRSTIGDTGLSYDVGVIEVMYPGNRTALSAARADTTEVYGALTYSYFTFKVNYAATNLYGVKNSDGSYYSDLTANYPVPAEWTGISGLSLLGHIGYQKVLTDADANALPAGSNLSYADYKVGASKAWENGVTVGGYYTKTNANQNLYMSGNDKSIGSPAITLFVTKTF